MQDSPVAPHHTDGQTVAAAPILRLERPANGQLYIPELYSNLYTLTVKYRQQIAEITEHRITE